MPDILGPLYEAVLTHCLQSRGESATVGAARPVATCRTTCPYAPECTEIGHEPTVDVDPDVLGKTADSTHLVGFVTHWRTTGFEKKFWRTVEEIFQHQTHRPGGVGISFVAEPISQSDRLRLSLGALAGTDVDMTNVWNPELQNAVERMEESVDRGTIPSDAAAALDFVAANVLSMKPLFQYTSAVSGVLRTAALKPSCQIPVLQLYQVCIESRRRSAQWRIRDIRCSLRTPAQLLALSLFALEADGFKLIESDFARAQVLFGRGGDFGALRTLASTPYRIAGKVQHSFVALVDTIRGPVLRFEERAFPSDGRTPGVLALARAYLEYLKKDETWSGYLERLTHGMLGPNRRPRVLELSRDDAHAAVVAAVERAENGWELDLLISAAGLSQVRLAAAADHEFTRLTGSGLKAVSAFGDEAKKVVSYCTRNRSGDLRNAPGLGNKETLRALSDALWSVLADSIEWPLQMDLALQALRVRDMRTFLSGAPHPVLGALSVALAKKNIRHNTDQQVPTVVTSWYGGKTGRTEYQFEIHGGPRPLFIKVSTGQDGNEGHKWKELAGRVRAHRVIAGDVDVWLVLDGEWSKDAVRKLHEAGYARVFGVDEIAELASDLSEWVRG